MDIKELKNILTKIEVLAVDTEIFREFINKVQKKEVNLSKYITILDTISLILSTSNLQEGSSSAQLDVIFDHLNNKMSDQEFNAVESQIKTINKSSVEKDLLILSTLVDIKKDLDLLKNKPVEHIVSENKVEELGIKIDSVFVKPELNISSITGRLNVEEVISDNATSKLDKLKQLRRN